MCLGAHTFLSHFRVETTHHNTGHRHPHFLLFKIKTKAPERLVKLSRSAQQEVAAPSFEPKESSA